MNLPRTNIFFDTEFTGLHQNTTLISFGAISEGGSIFYEELNDYDESQVDGWIRDNVINNLYKPASISIDELKYKLGLWLRQFDDRIMMWTDCGAYDWVLFCELWGGSINLPEWISYIPGDICTMFHNARIDPDINRISYSGIDQHEDYESSKHLMKHNALFDAQVTRLCYNKLMNQQESNLVLQKLAVSRDSLSARTSTEVPKEELEKYGTKN